MAAERAVLPHWRGLASKFNFSVHRDGYGQLNCAQRAPAVRANTYTCGLPPMAPLAICLRWHVVEYCRVMQFNVHATNIPSTSYTYCWEVVFQRPALSVPLRLKRGRRATIFNLREARDTQMSSTPAVDHRIMQLHKHCDHMTEVVSARWATSRAASTELPCSASSPPT